MRVLHYHKDKIRDYCKYIPHEDILCGMNLNNSAVFIDGNKYFCEIDDKTICCNEENREDWFFRDMTEFARRCIKARLKFLGISVEKCEIVKDNLLVKFKTDADYAFFTLHFSNYFYNK